MLGVNGRSVKQARLMGMSFHTVRMLLIAVIVLNIQMRMRWRPLDHQKGGKQKENKNFTGTLLDHDGIEFNPDCSLGLQSIRCRRPSCLIDNLGLNWFQTFLYQRECVISARRLAVTNVI